MRIKTRVYVGLTRCVSLGLFVLYYQEYVSASICTLFFNLALL